MSELDSQFTAGDFETINEIFDKVDVDKMTTSAVIALMTYTLCVIDKIPNRADFVIKARQRLIHLAPDRVDALMKGLE